MSKKRIPFATGGWVNTQSSGDMPFSGEIVVTKEEQERLAELLKNPPAPNAETVVISGEELMRVLPKADINRKKPKSMWEHIEAMREEHRKTRLEDNHPVMEFLEDIIYCPSQIDFYFRADGQVMCLYIRQRHGETTAQLVPCYGNGEYLYDSLWPEVELSRDYDIEGKSNESEDAEEQEIIAIEKDCLARLRVMFPDVPFPEHPNRRRGRGYKRLPDVTL